MSESSIVRPSDTRGMQATATDSQSPRLRPSPLSLLPAELEYAILAWLQDDKPAVVSFSLVCRRWRPIGQSVLFHEVKFAGSTAFDRVSKFLPFIRANLDIAGYIHVLRLEGLHGPGLLQVSWNALRMALGTMVHLHTLTLVFVALRFDATPAPAASPASDIASVRRPNAALKELTIAYCEDVSSRNRVSDLLCIICTFSEIGHLVIEGNEWTTPSNIVSEHCRQHAPWPVVQSSRLYRLHHACIAAIHTILRASGSFDGRMSYLDICAKTRPAAVALADLVREAGPHLHTLRLQLEYGLYRDLSVNDFCHALDLSTCTVLQVLQLTFWTYAELTVWLSASFRASADLLMAHRRALSALSAVCITIDADRAGYCAMNALIIAGKDAWRPMDEAFREFRRLDRLEVVVRDCNANIDDWQREIVPGIVAEGLSSLLAAHAGTDDFFHFDCHDY